MFIESSASRTRRNPGRGASPPAPAGTRQRRWAGVGASLAIVMLAGCATPQPVVYQKPQSGAAKSARVDKDVQDCRRLADTAVGLNSRSASSAAQSSARAGVIGFAATAAGALVAAGKDTWQRARAGAAAGATGIAAKTLLEWNDPDGVYQKYVERCMEDRGHDVLGWR